MLERRLWYQYWWNSLELITKWDLYTYDECIYIWLHFLRKHCDPKLSKNIRSSLGRNNYRAMQNFPIILQYEKWQWSYVSHSNLYHLHMDVNISGIVFLLLQENKIVDKFMQPKYKVWNASTLCCIFSCITIYRKAFWIELHLHLQ